MQYLSLGPGISEEGARRFKEKKPEGSLSRVTFGSSSRLMRLLIESGTVRAHALDIPDGADFEDFLKLARGRDDLEAVWCASPALGDDAMGLLANQRRLKAFSNLLVNPATLTSDGIERLRECGELRVLELCSANTFSDKSVAEVVKHCSDLERLVICDSGPPLLGPLTLAALAGRAKLKHLEIRGFAPETDGSFLAVFARNLPQLRELTVSEDRAEVADEEVAAFRRARPEVQVSFPPGRTVVFPIGEVRQPPRSAPAPKEPAAELF